jgi:hypothetical protein
MLTDKLSAILLAAFDCALWAHNIAAMTAG